MTFDEVESVVNGSAYAVGTVLHSRYGKKTRFRIRRVVWGRLMARTEKREGEAIRRVRIVITAKKS